ncbi:MAG: SDR family oxidoreductase [Dehalococcoidia bacterium]|jgi:NAD(P)-dependent dehydrogenase (short-subunit alcohol dehydrogenase family)
MSCSKISLAGKVALITGGSRGIGEATAYAFADAGANVVVASRKQADLDRVAEAIRKKGVKSLAIASHAAKTDESKNLVEKVLAEFGRIDILMNNAGTNPYYGPLMETEEWAWDATMNLNLKGLFFLSQLVARVMKKQDSGCIINVSSLGGIRPGELGVYQTSKAAVIMLTQCMAKEWGQYNIRVNALAPGVIKTRLAEALWKDPVLAKSTANDSALLRLGEPDDVAGVALFLASDLAKYVTGETILVDGGRIMGAPSYQTRFV